LDASPTMTERGTGGYPDPVRTEPLRMALEGEETVPALLLAADRILAGYHLVHGAGAGMTHPFLTGIRPAVSPIANNRGSRQTVV
jgi:hypothetical protein